jgi:hypothetical protein
VIPHRGGSGKTQASVLAEEIDPIGGDGRSEGELRERELREQLPERPRVHDVNRVARQPDQQAELDNLGFAAFDIVDVDGAGPSPTFSFNDMCGQTGSSDTGTVQPLQVTLTKRYSHGLYLLAGYTYGHAIDTATSNLAGVPPDSNNYSAERGNGDYDIRHRFSNREVTTGQILMFGLTGGLLPCPAAVTVLLLCLQLKKFTLGVTLVLGFSVGLALTMVASGALAALGVKHLSRRFGSFTVLARRAPYFSGVLILFVGLYLGYQGVRALA